MGNQKIRNQKAMMENVRSRAVVNAYQYLKRAKDEEGNKKHSSESLIELLARSMRQMELPFQEKALVVEVATMPESLN